jgi:hypothetical protein
VFGYVEDAVYLGLAVLLAGMAVVLLVRVVPLFEGVAVAHADGMRGA